jgi:hypothetical protein
MKAASPQTGAGTSSTIVHTSTESVTVILSGFDVASPDFIQTEFHLCGRTWALGLDVPSVDYDAVDLHLEVSTEPDTSISGHIKLIDLTHRFPPISVFVRDKDMEARETDEDQMSDVNLFTWHYKLRCAEPLITYQWWPDFVSFQELPRYLRNQSLSFDISLSVGVTTEIQRSAQRCGCLEDMLRTTWTGGASLPVVTIKFSQNDLKLTVYKHVLVTNSSYFRELFSHDARNATSELLVDDVAPHTMEELIGFMYTGEFSVPSYRSSIDKLKELHAGAYKLGVAEAWSLCIDAISVRLCRANVQSILVHSDAVSDVDLKRVCVSYIRNNCSDVFFSLQYAYGGGPLANPEPSPSRKVKTTATDSYTIRIAKHGAAWCVMNFCLCGVDWQLDTV